MIDRILRAILFLAFSLGLALFLRGIIRLVQRFSRWRDRNKPILTEEALVHRKSDFTTRLQTFYFLHFFVAQRDIVVDCQVPREIWEQLNKGDRGTLCHRGGTFLSFTREGEVFSPNSAARSSSDIT